MIDLDRALVAAVIVGGVPALRAAIDRGIQSDHLQGGDAKAVWDFVLDYWKGFSAVPSREVVFGRTSVDLQELDNPDQLGAAQFFIEEVVNRNLFLALQRAANDLVKHLEQRKPREALEALDRMVREQRLVADVATVVELSSLAESVISEYERAAAGSRGVPLPWPTLTEATLGLWPEDLAIIVARSGVGKTWTGLLFALSAWLSGKRVLFVTTEMSQARVSKRFFSLLFKIPYGDFHKGTLPQAAWVNFREQIRGFRNDRIKLIGGAFDFTMSSLEAAIDEMAPDLVIVDGAYLLVTEGRDRTERAANAFNALKRIGKRKKVPVVAMTQFNRSAAGGKKGENTISLENIALTDVVGWNSDIVFGLNQTPDDKADRRMWVHTLKLREGAIPEPLNVSWDFVKMNFDEITAVSGDAGEPDWIDPAAGVEDNQSTVPF